MSNAVTLQISLAPTDYAHAQTLLVHQARTWRSQVSEILITIDFHRSPGRFSARWEQGAKHIRALAESVPQARVVEVDYSPAARQRVADEFFGGVAVPVKDFRGGPFYAYFFGLAEAEHDLVLHIDSDMFFGGGSPTWVAEAIAQLNGDRSILFMAPLSGPPRADGRLVQLRADRDPGEVHAHWFDGMSTRIFLLSRARFRETIGALQPRRPPAAKDVVIARLEGNPPQDLPEHLFTAAMRRQHLRRYEFLGLPPGMWTLHPPYRGADFYRRLPELVRRIETGDVPDAQRGDHDINDSMVDWSEGRAALRQNRLWHRLWRRFLRPARPNS